MNNHALSAKDSVPSTGISYYVQEAESALTRVWATLEILEKRLGPFLVPEYEKVSSDTNKLTSINTLAISSTRELLSQTVSGIHSAAERITILTERVDA